MSNGDDTGWRLDKDTARFNAMNSAEQTHYDAFQNNIYHHSMHPRLAAREAGIHDYESLTGGLCSIRLSQAGRCYFRVHDGTKTVTIVEVGGHRLS